MGEYYTWLGDENLRVEEDHLGQINIDHVRIHDNNIFTASHYEAVVANNGSVMLSGSIPANFYPHGEFSVATGGNATMEIIEGGTLTGGSAVTVYNRNRNAADSSIATIAYAAGTLTGGTVIFSQFMPGGQKNFAAGTGSRSESEWVFLPNKVTTFRVTNISGGNAGISVECDFYRGSPGRYNK